jgi:4-amino-4-deoxy-L-arabinose transferase-like glycosyltransferase
MEESMTKDSQRRGLIPSLILVLVVRLAFLAFFHHQTFSGPSAQYDHAFVAMNLLDGHGVKTFKEPPATVAADDPTRILDPEKYVVPSSDLLPYIKEVPGYAFFLAGLWFLFGTKLWIFAQICQILFEVLAGWGIYALSKKFFGRKAALLSVLLFAFLFYEARTSVIPYRDIFIFYLTLVITILASRLFLREGRPWIIFLLISIVTGAGYYFMTNILFFPMFLVLAFLVLKRIHLKTAVAWLLLAAAVVGLIILPYHLYVQANKSDPGVMPPLYWYRFWIGLKVRVFYSVEEERYQDFFHERIQATGQSLEEICKDEFLTYVKAHPIPYAFHTVKKLLYGTFLVYANAGDATYPASYNYYKTQNPQAGFLSYARAHPFRILGMLLGTLSASILFPLALLALFLLRREKKTDIGLFFFAVPLYFILVHMFFHYEARFLTGALAGYLPLAGYVFSKIRLKKRRTAGEA